MQEPAGVRQVQWAAGKEKLGERHPMAVSHREGAVVVWNLRFQVIMLWPQPLTRGPGWGGVAHVSYGMKDLTLD